MAAAATTNDASDAGEARVESAPSAHTPRPITAEVRKRVGLPKSAARYPWARAIILTGVFGLPLALAGYGSITAILALVALIVLPAWRAIERRESTARERLYTHGGEAVARVVEIEPAGAGRRDHVVHVEYYVGNTRHDARIVAAPLARQGLRPGDDASIVFDPKDPTRCLLIRKIARVRAAEVPTTTSTEPKAEGAPVPEIFDAVFDEEPTPMGGGGGCGHSCGCR